MTVPARGSVTVRRWDARCKDCQRLGRGDDQFGYPDSWARHVLDRGGSRSDRCPACRKVHNRDIASMAIPYIDIDVIGRIADADNPTGPLGGLGPLPTEHDLTEEISDLGSYDFGLIDDDVLHLLHELEAKQVAVVVAGTGSGKSTFLPYRLLEPPEGARLRLADHGTIVVTEPRVFATKDVAGFVAGGLHRSLPVGAGCEIGYRVKDEPAYDAGCRLLFVTDGSLINWLRDGSIDRFSAIVIDEAHERSRNIDLILGVLRAELPRRRHLRVIIASATIDADFFVEYFGGPERVVKVIVDADKRFGYGIPLWPGEDINVAHEDWDGTKGEDLRDLTRQYMQLRVLRSEADVPRIESWRDRMPTILVEQIAAIVSGTAHGDVLGFLPSKNAIDDAVAALDGRLGPDVDVYPLYRGVAERVQVAAREVRPPGARRRVVIATNIAETSLTLNGMTFVVDSGLITQSSWDVASASKTLRPVPHSQDGVRQRWGRVGRRAPGWVFPLYSREQYESLPHHTPPESVRDDLEGFVLQAAAIGIDPLDYVWPASFERADDDPATRQFRAVFLGESARARRALTERGLLDDDGDVTPAGAELLAFNGQLAHANALAGADELSCGVEMATVLTLLGGPGGSRRVMPFNRNAPARTRNALRRVYGGLRAGCLDDVDLALKVYAGWEQATDPAAWAHRHALDHQSLLAITRGARKEAIAFLSPGRKSEVSQRVRPELAARVRAVLSRAFVDLTFVERDGQWVVRGEEGEQREYLLSSPGFTPVDGVLVALHRHPAGPHRAILSGLVEVYPWAQEAESWLALAIEVARRYRRADGTLHTPTAAEHFALADRFPIGSRHQCLVMADGDDHRAWQPSLVEAAPAPISAASVADDGTVELDVDASEMLELTTDLTSLLGRDDVVTDPTAEDQYEDLAEVETSEIEPPADAAASRSDGNEMDIRPDDASPLIRAVTGERLPAGRLIFRVLGYDGVGEDRALVVSTDGDPTPFDRALAAGYRPDMAISVSVTEHVAGWGPPFVVAVDTETALEVALGPLELAVSADDQTIAEDIPVGTVLDVTLLAIDRERRVAEATRFPQLLNHLERAPAALEGQHRWYAARATGQAWSGVPVVALEHADESRHLLHRFVVPRRKADELQLSEMAGMSLSVTLGTKVRGRIQSQLTRDLPAISEQLAARLAALCDLEPKHLLFDSGDPPRLIVVGPLSGSLRFRLTALSDSPGWRETIAALWRQSNTLGIDRIKLGGAAAASLIARTREEYGRNVVVDATIDKVADFGVFARFGQGRSGLIHRSMIGPRGVVGDLTILFQEGMSVRPRVEQIDEHESRGVEFKLSLRDFELDAISQRPVALVDVPDGAMGRLIGREHRGLREIEHQFGVHTAVFGNQAIMGGGRREHIEAAIAAVRLRPGLEGVTVTWLLRDGSLPSTG